MEKFKFEGNKKTDKIIQQFLDQLARENIYVESIKFGDGQEMKVVSVQSASR